MLRLRRLTGDKDIAAQVRLPRGGSREIYLSADAYRTLVCIATPEKRYYEAPAVLVQPNTAHLSLTLQFATGQSNLSPISPADF